MKDQRRRVRTKPDPALGPSPPCNREFPFAPHTSYYWPLVTQVSSGRCTPPSRAGRCCPSRSGGHWPRDRLDLRRFGPPSKFDALPAVGPGGRSVGSLPQPEARRRRDPASECRGSTAAHLSAKGKALPRGLGAAEEKVSRAAVYYELTKPGIAGYVMVTAGASFYLGAGGRAEIVPVLHTLLGTLVATAGALALNQYVEREIDALMERTKRRPLPSGRLKPREAFLFGSGMVVVGVGYLGLACGWLPALLTALAAVAYNLIYTPLKTRSPLATPAGAVPGALPTLIGWTAATGTLSTGALALFATLFLWQMPHVLSLGWLLREDYARAKIRLLPPSDPGGRRIAWRMLVYSAALVLASTAPWVLGLTGPVYLAGMSLLGLLVLLAAGAAVRRLDRTAARHVFLGSLLYHPAFLVLIVIDAVRV